MRAASLSNRRASRQEQESVVQARPEAREATDLYEKILSFDYNYEDVAKRLEEAGWDIRPIGIRIVRLADWMLAPIDGDRQPAIEVNGAAIRNGAKAR